MRSQPNYIEVVVDVNVVFVDFIVFVAVHIGVQSHFHVQPNCSVEVVLWLCCVVVGVVTIFFSLEFWI